MKPSPFQQERERRAVLPSGFHLIFSADVEGPFVIILKCLMGEAVAGRLGKGWSREGWLRMGEVPGPSHLCLLTWPAVLEGRAFKWGF